MTTAENNLIQANRRNNYTREFIKMYFPKDYKFYLSDIFSVCPYSLSDLTGRNKTQGRVYWRNLLMIYHVMNGKSITDAGIELNRHHSTVIHAIDQLYLARTKRNRDFEDIILMVLNSQNSDILETTDINVNEAISLAHSESKFFERYPELRT